MVKILTEEQIRILRFCFKLRIEQMKEGKLSHDYYVESGQFYEDLYDAGIAGHLDKNVFMYLDKIFKDELIKASFNNF